MNITSPARTRSVPALWKGVLAAALIAPVVNSIIFLIAYGAGIFPALTLDPAAGAQMSIEPVLLVSLIAAGAGVSIFGLFRQRGEIRRFYALAAVILLVSFAAPFVIPGGTTTIQAIVLNSMHLAAAAVVFFIAGRMVR
jgi:hypothetical protein